MHSIAFRMIYALSNAGADPNVTDVKGNTPLHEALIQGSTDSRYDLIQVFCLITFAVARCAVEF
jgi:ankyrin repeat protein